MIFRLVSSHGASLSQFISCHPALIARVSWEMQKDITLIEESHRLQVWFFSIFLQHHSFHNRMKQLLHDVLPAVSS